MLTLSIWISHTTSMIQLSFILMFVLIGFGCATTPHSKKPNTLYRRVEVKVRQDGKIEQFSRVILHVNEEEFVYCENSQVIPKGAKAVRTSWDPPEGSKSKTVANETLKKVFDEGNSISESEKCIIKKCGSDNSCRLFGDTSLNSDF